MNANTKPSITNCLECEAPLRASEQQGLCARCLLKLGLASSLDIGAGGARQSILQAPPLMPFDFGGYRVLRLLGRGGMGAVYEAEQIATGRRLALKVLGRAIDDDELRRRFLREGRLAAGVTHPNCVYIYGSEEIEGTPVIAMEIVGGGTLRDLVKKRGPLPIAEAVDITLQIVAGLEAAATAGVLHRDIKPANCFVGTDGTVKVGDFGLSVSTLARQDSQLTASGAVLGTPSFAAPEQLRGEALDERADIFSVGTTLYCLLTGNPPFDGDNAVQVVAAVLEKTPAPLDSVRSEVPAGLAAVVARCLEKKRDARFPNYAELRAALLPFSSTAAIPAKPVTRLLAYLPDMLIALIPGLLANDENVHHALALAVFDLLLFAGCESRWGATPGKMLLGLRVTRLAGGNPTFVQALVRAAVFFAPGLAYYLAQLVSSEFAKQVTQASGYAFAALAALALATAAMFSTMRRRNGYAGVHELASKTRTVHSPKKSTLLLAGQKETFDQTAPGIEHIGPFLARAAVDGTAFRSAFDPVLQRPVWLCPEGTTSESDRSAARAGRLRWIGAVQDEKGGLWEAWESAGGFSPYTRAFSSQPWSVVRSWLSDLAGEMDAASRTEETPEPVSLEQIRITENGRALLLPTRALPAQAATFSVTPSGTQAFITAVADRWLDASTISASGRECLDRIAGGTLDRMSFIAGNLAACLQHPAEVSRSRRLLSMTALPGLVGFFSMLVFFALDVHFKKQAAFDREYPGHFPIIALTNYHVGSKMLSESAELGEVSRQLDRAAAVYLAVVSRKFIESPDFEQKTKAVLDTDDQAAARSMIAGTGSVSDEEFKSAKSLLASTGLLQEPGTIPNKSWVPLMIGAVLLSIACGVHLIWVGATGHSLALGLFGMALVNSQGRKPGRLRVIARSLIGYLPLGVALYLTVPTIAEQPGYAAFVGAAMLLFYIVGAVFATSNPRRGIIERILGLFIVPR